MRNSLRDDLRMELTQPVATLITAGMSATVALVAVLINRWSTNKTLGTQREMTYDERVWRERSTLYVELADLVQQQIDVVAMRIGGPQSQRTPVVFPDAAALRRLRARIQVYASCDTRARSDELLEVVTELSDWNESQHGIDHETKAASMKAQEFDTKLIAAQLAFVAQIHKELGLDS